MSSDPYRRDPPGRVEPARRRAVQARDAGLSRISTVTRWTIAGVVALSGALALVADRAFHGHSVSDGSASSTATQPPASGTPATGSPSSLQPPAQTPVQTPAAPVVTSGGS